LQKGAKLRHGFKAEAERRSLEFRRQLNLPAYAPLPGRVLAEHMGIVIISPEEVPGLSPEDLRLLTEDCHWWSAGLLKCQEGALILLNTIHTPARQESDIMHEIAHEDCGHEAVGFYQQPGCPFPLRSFDACHEGEAEYLGACLQIPRDGLLWALRRGMTSSEIADHFGASEQMVRFRRNITGVDAQFSRRPRTLLRA
jgi:hypothetical protein